MNEFNQELDLLEYLNFCRQELEFDVEEYAKLTKEIIKTFNSNVKLDNSYTHLFDKWNETSETNPDYSVYVDPLYVCESWLCWKLYSKKSIHLITKHDIFQELTKDITSIADLGCGTGLTTAYLKKHYKNAKVIGTNFEDSYQYRIATKYGKLYGFDMIPNLNVEVDLIFASEYFEHFYRPIEHLLEILSYNPKYMVIANAFGTDAIGHFKEYGYNNSKISSKNIGKIFNNTLRNNGYSQIFPRCWNNRPTLWMKTTDTANFFE